MISNALSLILASCVCVCVCVCVCAHTHTLAHLMPHALFALSPASLLPPPPLLYFVWQVTVGGPTYGA